MSDDPLTLLKKVQNQGLAQIIRGLMESNDIPCVVFDDNPAGIGAGLLDTRVMVPKSYLPKAQSLLKESEDAL